MFGKPFVPNVVTYSILMVLTYAMLVDAGLVQPKEPATLLRQADAVDLGAPQSGSGIVVDEEVPFADANPPQRSPQESGVRDARIRPLDEASEGMTAPERPTRTASDLVLPPTVDPDAFRPVLQ